MRQGVLTDKVLNYSDIAQSEMYLFQKAAYLQSVGSSRQNSFMFTDFLNKEEEQDMIPDTCAYDQLDDSAATNADSAQYLNPYHSLEVPTKTQDDHEFGTDGKEHINELLQGNRNRQK